VRRVCSVLGYVTGFSPDRRHQTPIHPGERTHDAHCRARRAGSWYWRTVGRNSGIAKPHFLPALAAAGCHAAAPDMRGYGQTDAPPNMQDYTQLQLVGDAVGLVHAPGCEQAVITGHDLGAMVAHNGAILRPDMFRAVILLSVPYGARGQADQSNAQAHPPGTTVLPNLFPDTPGVAEKEFDADPQRTLRMFLTRFLAQFRRSTNGATCWAKTRRRWTAARIRSNSRPG
jgi:pimeloyl-ACP methyl ester carboxylesterase